MQEEILQELAQMEKPTEATQEAPPQPTAKEIEAYEYFLGDKSSKIPGNAEFQIKHNGQPMRVPASKLINEYRQSAHLQEKLKALSEEKAKWDAQAKEYETLKASSTELEPFRKLQEWSVNRPEAFDFVMKHMHLDENGLLQLNNEAQAQGNVQVDGLNRTIQQLKEELSGLKSWKSQIETEYEEGKTQQEMQVISQEIEQYQEDLKKRGFDINLEDRDENGVMLKASIINFAIENGIKKFPVAANAYLQDALLTKAQEKARSEAVKGVKGDAQAGIVSRSRTPSTGQSVDVRRMSPEAMKSAALAEYERLAAEDKT